jgi:hypothetical protein
MECGGLPFETVFLPWTLTPDGRPVSERAQEMLPSPSPKVVSLPVL